MVNACGTDTANWKIEQQSPNSGWGSWASMGGGLSSALLGTFVLG
ncbi:hypothetical protein [Streptomyces sp. NPDC058240]